MKLAKSIGRVGLIGVLSLGAMIAGTATAGTLSLTCELLASGGSTACPASAPTYAVPGQYTHTREFSNPTGSGQIAGSNIYGGPANGNLGPVGFIDDYFFQI